MGWLPEAERIISVGNAPESDDHEPIDENLESAGGHATSPKSIAKLSRETTSETTSSGRYDFRWRI